MSASNDAIPRRRVVELLDPMIVEILRQKTPAERLSQAFRMWNTARLITIGSVRQQYPEWCEADVLRETARRPRHGATELVPR